MKYLWDRKYLYWGITAFCVIAAAILLFLFISHFEMIIGKVKELFDGLSAIVYGFIIAYLLSPVMNFFEKKCFVKLITKLYSKKGAITEITHKKIVKLSRVFALCATMLTALAAATALVIAVIPQVVDAVKSIVANMDGYVASANTFVTNALKGLPDFAKSVSEVLTNYTTYLINWLKDVIPQMSNIGKFLGSIMTTLSMLLNLVVGFVVCVYLLYGKKNFSSQGKKALYGVFPVSTANKIIKFMRELHYVFGGFITGKIIDSIIVGFAFFIVCALFRMPYLVLISVVCGVMNIIPFFGPFLGAIPCTLLVFAVDPIKALYFVIIALVIMQIDGNIIEPKILGDKANLSSFWIIFSLMLGKYLFGVWGLVIAIPIFSLIYKFFKITVTKKLNEKGLPSATEEYDDIMFIVEKKNDSGKI